MSILVCLLTLAIATPGVAANLIPTEDGTLYSDGWGDDYPSSGTEQAENPTLDTLDGSFQMRSEEEGKGLNLFARISRVFEQLFVREVE